MATLLKCGALFLHIPKTGGNWISKVLEENNLVFAHIGEAHDDMDRLAGFEHWFRVSYKYSKPNRPFFRFCFVRHPLKWYESWFRFMTGLGWPNWSADARVRYPLAILDGLGDSDFTKFISNVLERHPGYVTELYSRYTAPGIHFVGRYERLAEDLIAVLRYLNVQFDESRLRSTAPVNVSKKMDLQWPPELQEAVERAEYTAFKRFGYKTERYLPEETARARDGESLFVFDPNLTRLDGPFVKGEGCTWSVAIPQFMALADDLEDPYRSPLVLLEDGQPLPLPHALHDDISSHGQGRFSHWKTHLFFSTRDNSDPNTNGRVYQIKFQFGSPLALDHLLLKPYPIVRIGAAQGEPNLRERELAARTAELSVRESELAARERQWLGSLRTYVVTGQPLLNRHVLTAPFTHEGEHSWVAGLPDLAPGADNDELPTRSILMLFENENPLGPAHSLHDDIRNKGDGRFSHWKDALYFSASDGSDPNTNGRKYTIVFVQPARQTTPTDEAKP